MEDEMATEIQADDLQWLDLSGMFGPEIESGVSHNIDGFFRMLENYTDPDNFDPDIYPDVSPETKHRVCLAAHELVAALAEAENFREEVRWIPDKALLLAHSEAYTKLETALGRTPTRDEVRAEFGKLDA
jgi:hypothetical protein